MVDIDTHRIIDLLASRESADVAEWLKSYPNLEVVSRDGSISYKSAIEQAGRHLQQVSDCFHLVKGLMDAAKKFLSRLLTANFILPTEASHYNGKPTGDYWDKPVKEDAPVAEHNANVKKKKKTVEQVREFGKQGLNKSEIARIVGINRVTVAKYLKDDFNPSSAYYNTTIPSKIKPYSQEIKNMLSEGKTFKQISAVIRERGYDGADGTIRMFATRERRLMKEAAEQGGSGEKIERKWLISLLYHPVDEVRSLSQDQLDRIIEEYPIIGRVYDAVTGFKGALFIFDFQADLFRFTNITDLFNILYLGVGASALCFVTWNFAVKELGPVKTSVYIYMVPIITVITSVLILHEQLTLLTATGTILTLIGLFLSEYKAERKDAESGFAKGNVRHGN